MGGPTLLLLKSKNVPFTDGCQLSGSYLVLSVILAVIVFDFVRVVPLLHQAQNNQVPQAWV